MSTFKECVIEGPVAKVAEAVQKCCTNLDDALSLFRQEQEDYSKSRRARSKRSGNDEDMDFTVLELHDRLAGHWQQFGFLNSSDPLMFLRCVKSNIITRASFGSNDEDVDVSEEEE